MGYLYELVVLVVEIPTGHFRGYAIYSIYFRGVKESYRFRFKAENNNFENEFYAKILL